MMLGLGHSNSEAAVETGQAQRHDLMQKEMRAGVSILLGAEHGHTSGAQPLMMGCQPPGGRLVDPIQVIHGGIA